MSNEKAVGILETYFKEIYESLGKEWTEENKADMQKVVIYLNTNLPQTATVLEVLDNGKVRVKLEDGSIKIIDKL
jgi:hypothetical protein